MELKTALKNNDKYHIANYHGGDKIIRLICRNEKIIVPDPLQDQGVDWYHHSLGHPGINRTKEMIGQHLWWPKMRDHITHSVSTCGVCQKNKRRSKKYGIMPEKKAQAEPWETLCVDLIGPYTIHQKGKKKSLICKACTMIDPATGWFEIHEYIDKKSITIANIVEQEWLSQYPRPSQIIYN